MGRATVIACLAWVCSQAGAQEIEQFVGTRRVESAKPANKPAPAPEAPKPEAPKENKTDAGPAVIAVASPLRRVDFREPVEPLTLPVLRSAKPVESLALPTPAKAEEPAEKPKAAEAKAAVTAPPANPRPPFENPQDVWEWIVVLGNDMQSVSLGLGSAATMLALVAIMRPRPVNQAPVVNVTMPQSQAPVYGWGPPPAQPRRRKKKRKDNAEAELPPREANFTLGPSFEEERAMLDAQASQAEEALLMGLVDANVALRGAISAETEPAKAG
jgi:hypothetical protein